MLCVAAAIREEQDLVRMAVRGGWLLNVAIESVSAISCSYTGCRARELLHVELVAKSTYKHKSREELADFQRMNVGTARNCQVMRA
jgi:hypothetical protein